MYVIRKHIKEKIMYLMCFELEIKLRVISYCIFFSKNFVFFDYSSIEYKRTSISFTTVIFKRMGEAIAR